jgi:hypothetical protein
MESPKDPQSREEDRRELREGERAGATKDVRAALREVDGITTRIHKASLRVFKTNAATLKRFGLKARIPRSGRKRRPNRKARATATVEEGHGDGDGARASAAPPT